MWSCARNSSGRLRGRGGRLWGRWLIAVSVILFPFGVLQCHACLRGLLMAVDSLIVLAERIMSMTITDIVVVDLEIIATLPEYQGKGAAGQLMRWGVQRADELGVPCYLEANTLGRPIYERFGFRVAGEFTLEEIGHVEYFMVREPKAK